MYTEFVSTEALTRVVDPVARRKVTADLIFHEIERPIVAQLFGSDPKQMAHCVQMMHEVYKFDGVDINMGCPDRNICRSGAGAELIKTPDLAQKIVDEAKRAVEGFPISVKTRIGISSPNELDAWLQALFDVEPAAITVHLRTKRELSLVPAHWTPDVVGRIVEIKKRSGRSTLLLCNGDVQTHKEAKEKALQWGLDGVMVGRGIFGTLSFFPLM